MKIWVVEEVFPERRAIAAYTKELKAHDEMMRLIQEDQAQRDAQIQAAENRHESYAPIRVEHQYRCFPVELIESERED